MCLNILNIYCCCCCCCCDDDNNNNNNNNNNNTNMNNNTNTNMGSQCCKCMSSGICVACPCARQHTPCLNCYPSRVGRCRNLLAFQIHLGPRPYPIVKMILNFTREIAILYHVSPQLPVVSLPSFPSRPSLWSLSLLHLNLPRLLNYPCFVHYPIRISSGMIFQVLNV